MIDDLGDRLDADRTRVIGGRQDPSGHAAYFDFTADGHATGGRITLSDGRQAAIVVVDWLTGSAAVETSAP